MARDEILEESQLAQELESMPGWKSEGGWLRKTYITPGWPHTMMLVQAIGYVAEAAWHHPDLSVGYAEVGVKIQTHRVRGITAMDVDLARRIDQTALWKPADDSSLQGFPKNWVRGKS